MLKIITVVVSLLAALVGPQQSDASADEHAYAQQTPYGNPEATPTRRPPGGYELVFLENLGRHGSRSQTSDVSERRALTVWTAAANKGQLTSTGERFDDDLRKFQAAEKSIGYGRLSAMGRTEWTGIGRRTATNYRAFLTKAATSGDDIEFKTTSVERTKQSASALHDSLDAAIPGLDLKPQATDDRMLLTTGVTTKGNAAVAKVEGSSDVRAAARRVLLGLYTTSYVDSLSNPVSNALDIYGLYAIAAGMQGDTDVDFSQYMPLAEARIMAYARDAQNFYRYGPGIAGETSSYSTARPVLQDFFAQLDKRLAGGHTAAVFRLAHGETTMPFAVLAKLPGSTRQAPVDTLYAYDNNPWRGEVAGRMAGNIEWAAYRNAAGAVLVTVRYNERPVTLDRSCRQSNAARGFYQLSALKRCLL
jgi:hypothetical protein